MTRARGEELEPEEALVAMIEVTGGRTDPRSVEHVDVVVIGAGSTGTNVAGYARDNGLSVAIVEAGLVGGECSYWACMPSKALLGPIHALDAARRLPGSAEAVRGPVDAEAVFERRDRFISELDDSSQVDWLESIGAELIRGRGRLVGERRVDVTTADGSHRHLSAERGVVIATGSRPSLPPIEGLAECRVWTNREATVTSEIPESLIVLGGGVVGCELAQTFRGLGSQVTILERSERLLGNYDRAVSEIIAEAMDAADIEVRTDARATSVSRNGTDGRGRVTVHLADGSTVGADELLVATGRSFNTDDLGLESIGLEVDGPLEVDDRLRVTAVGGGWLYAAGDVNGRALLTHQGKYQARCVGDLLAGREVTAIADGLAVPQVVFTDPEIAAVGLRESDCETNSALRVVTVGMDSVAAASLAGQTSGRASLIIDGDRNLLVGASFVGPSVGELLHSATIAIVGEVTIDRLWHAVPSFPTISEIWLRLLEADRGYGQ